MVMDDGTGLEQPIMQLPDAGMCIFDDGEGYSVRREGEGEVARFGYGASDDLWQGLQDQGWEMIDLESQGLTEGASED